MDRGFRQGAPSSRPRPAEVASPFELTAEPLQAEPLPPPVSLKPWILPIGVVAILASAFTAASWYRTPPKSVPLHLSYQSLGLTEAEPGVTRLIEFERRFKARTRSSRERPSVTTATGTLPGLALEGADVRQIEATFLNGQMVSCTLEVDADDLPALMKAMTTRWHAGAGEQSWTQDGSAIRTMTSGDTATIQFSRAELVEALHPMGSAKLPSEPDSESSPER